MDEAGWFIYESGVSYCRIDDMEGDYYHVRWQAQPVTIHKSHRFPTMLAAQLHNNSHRVAEEIADHKRNVGFFKAMVKSLEDRAEETDHKWFVKWGFLGNQDFKVKHMLWRHIPRGERRDAEEFEVQVLYKGIEWVSVAASLGFKTEGAAHMYAHYKTLEERIKDEQRLYNWLMSFSREPEKHGQELEYQLTEVE